MSLLEAVAASAVLVVSSSAAAQLWSQALRSSGEVARREEQLHRLDALLLASEGKAQELAGQQGVAAQCQGATGSLLPLLRALPAAQGAILTVPPSPAGTLHLRWEVGGMRRERLLSASALGLCRQGGHGS